ncbi:MAG: pyridoxal phosphate-dependent aminotransferase [Patescibacteria group bacterium]
MIQTKLLKLILINNMNYKLCYKITKVKPSSTLILDKQAKDMIRAGKAVINLTAGELDFPVPIEIRKKVAGAAKKGFNLYTPAAGLLNLKKEIILKLKRDNNLTYGLDQIIATNGAKQSLYTIFQVLLNEGDEVIVPVPYWVSYVEQIKLAGGKPVLANCDKDFNLDVKAIAEKITKKTKAIIINSPNNPTGKVYSEKTLKALAKTVKSKNIYVISDEIYEKMIYEKKHISIAKFLKNQTLIVNGFSKSHAITGWRIGYTAGPQDIISAMTNLQSHASGNVSNLSQIAGIIALKTKNRAPGIFLEQLKKRREILINYFSKIKGAKIAEPEGAFYIFFKIPKLTNNSDKFCQNLLKHGKVAMVPGHCFGKEGYVRLSYANSTKNIIRALKRIDKFINK